MSAALVNQLRALGTWLLKLPERLSVRIQRLKDATRSVRRSIKPHTAHFLKAFGLVITIAFAGASLYYAKKSADYSRCQLHLARDEYCRSHSEYVEGVTVCEDIFKKTSRVMLSCWADYRPGEWIFSLLGIYALGDLGCQGRLYHLVRGWPFLGYQSFFTLPDVSTRWWDPYPALQQFLVAYRFGIDGMRELGLRILPLTILAGVAMFASALLGHPIQTLRMEGALMLATIVLSAHPRLDPVIPWWKSWGHPYIGYRCEVPAVLRPILWRFPDAYRIAALCTSLGGTTPFIALAGATLLLNYGLEGRTRVRSLQTALFFGLVVLPVLGGLSWWLLTLELRHERRYWESVMKQNLVRKEYLRKWTNWTIEMRLPRVYGPAKYGDSLVEQLYESYHSRRCA